MCLHAFVGLEWLCDIFYGFCLDSCGHSYNSNAIVVSLIVAGFVRLHNFLLNTSWSIYNCSLWWWICSSTKFWVVGFVGYWAANTIGAKGCSFSHTCVVLFFDLVQNNQCKVLVEFKRWEMGGSGRFEREKPGPGQESVWDYPRPPRLEPVADKIRIEFNGKTLVDTMRAFRVLETSHPPG